MSKITILSNLELDKKHQLEQSVAEGIESGKRGFQQACEALLKIDELALWRDEAASFNAYRQKFKAVLKDLDITDRHLNRMIAAEKCVQMLRPTGLNIPQQYKERKIRPLTQLKQPELVQQAYRRALDIAETEGEELNCAHVQKAVEEIKPPKVRFPKPPIGAKVTILAHYPDEELHGAEGVVAQHPSRDRCIVRLSDENSLLIPDNMLKLVQETKLITSAKQEVKEQGRSLGVRTGLQALPDIERNDGIPTEMQQQEIEMAIASFLRILPKFSDQQKGLIYEQLVKSGFVPRRVAA
ncbi:hypothetical protein [Nostoc sp.]|uniref:hypothetical protein n=1 Tax=Nostoc sp. TaxID=1180 RepID=UPI002FFAC151